MNLLFFLLPFLSGFFIKQVDDEIDFNNKRPSLFQWFLYLFAILSFIFLSFFSNVFSMFLGIYLGLFFSGKIDRPAHIFGFIIFLLLSLFFGFPLDPLIIFFFSFASFIDEKIGKDEFRALCPLLAFFVSIFLTNPLYFIVLICFDLGYLFASKSSK